MDNTDAEVLRYAQRLNAERETLHLSDKDIERMTDRYRQVWRLIRQCNTLCALGLIDDAVAVMRKINAGALDDAERIALSAIHDHEI